MTQTIDPRYASLSVPRYTSYPTAPHFSADVGAEEAGRWLREVGPQEAVSLYLHVPYCRAICHYCGCHTKASRRDGPLIDYGEGLQQELALIAEALGRRQPVSHIHWGGGTPSLLPRDTFLAVVKTIRQAFAILPEAEHAIELDPRTVTAELAATLRDAGIGRTSLGVQDLDATVQQAMGRVQPFEVVAEAVAHLKAEGIDAINFDLMYGLPFQTAETIIDTVRRALTLQPSRIALFGYAHVPWFKTHQRLIDGASLPGAAARLELEAVARAELAAAGYVAIGLDHFAHPEDSMAVALREGQLKRNFQGYTTDTAQTLIGVGASSIGRLPGGFVQNALDVSHWRQAIEAGRLPIVKGKALDRDDRLRSDIIERLMCDYAVDLTAICARFGLTPAAVADAFPMLQDQASDGLVTIDGDQVTVTEAGRAYVRVVASAFDAYLPRNTARHSVAV